MAPPPPNGNDDNSLRLVALLCERIARLEMQLRLQMVANESLFVLPPPPPLEPELLLVPPPQEPLVAPAQEAPMVLPFAMAPPVLADAPVPVPHTLLPSVGDPLAPAAGADGAGVGSGGGGGGDDDDDNDDGFPRGGSYLLEMADAILDDGSGRLATDEDVNRLLWDHGLESFIKPKPM